MPADLLVAKVISAHGLQGEVRAKLFLSHAPALGRYGVLRTRDGRQVQVIRIKEISADHAVLTLKDVVDRSAAEAFAGAELFLNRDALPDPGEDEFYHTDLDGLPAYDSEGRLIGFVAAIHNFGAGDVIEIERAERDALLIAFTRTNVPVVDLKSRRLVVAVPDEVEADVP